MNGQKIYVLRRSKTEIHTYEGRSLRTAGVYPTHNGSHSNYDKALDIIEADARKLFNIDPAKLDRNSLPDSKLLQYLGYIEVEAEKLLRNWKSSKLN